jgi:hypothetical protein
MQDQVNALMRSRIQAILDQCQWNSSTPLSQYYANITQEAAALPAPLPAPLPASPAAPRNRTTVIVLVILMVLLLVGITCMMRLPAKDEPDS